MIQNQLAPILQSHAPNMPCDLRPVIRTCREFRTTLVIAEGWAQDLENSKSKEAALQRVGVAATRLLMKHWNHMALRRAYLFIVNACDFALSELQQDKES